MFIVPFGEAWPTYAPLEITMKIGMTAFADVLGPLWRDLF
jgi:hypothetical protein